MLELVSTWMGDRLGTLDVVGTPLPFCLSTLLAFGALPWRRASASKKLDFELLTPLLNHSSRVVHVTVLLSLFTEARRTVEEGKTGRLPSLPFALQKSGEAWHSFGNVCSIVGVKVGVFTLATRWQC